MGSFASTDTLPTPQRSTSPAFALEAGALMSALAPNWKGFEPDGARDATSGGTLAGFGAATVAGGERPNTHKPSPSSTTHAAAAIHLKNFNCDAERPPWSAIGTRCAVGPSPCLALGQLQLF